MAHNQAVTPDEVVEKAIRAYLQIEASQILERETLAFRSLHRELLEQYLDVYVALRQGQVVDQGGNLGEIYLRIDARYPDEIILIKQV